MVGTVHMVAQGMGEKIINLQSATNIYLWQ